ncbi:MAG: putative peptidoglycan-binding domain-containing protein [Prevotella sp.]
MADFNHYAPLLKKLEGYGKFTNTTSDRGGQTMSGVTLKTYQSVYGAGSTVMDLRSMDYNRWCYILKTFYWDKAKADLIINQSVAEIIADWCVNSGVSILKRIQRIVGVEADGFIGPKSISAINAADQQELHAKIKAARRYFYVNLAYGDPKQKKFLNGWINRLTCFNYEK